MGYGWGSVIEHFQRMQETLDLSPRIEERGRDKLMGDKNRCEMETIWATGKGEEEQPTKKITSNL